MTQNIKESASINLEKIWGYIDEKSLLIPEQDDTQGIRNSKFLDYRMIDNHRDFLEFVMQLSRFNELRRFL